jgi:hypothetical protein
MISGAHSVQAANNTYTLLEPLPCIGDECQGTKATIEIDEYISYVFKFAIAISVFLATIMIIFGGFQWMFSEVPGRKADGKSKINNAIYGLAAVLVSYLVLQTIDPRLVRIETKIQPICNEENSGAGQACDTKTTENLIRQLEKDFDRLGQETRAVVLDLDKQIEVIKKQRSDLQEKIKAGEDSEENGIELAKFNEQIRELSSQQTYLIANGSMSGYYKNAIEQIAKNNGGTDDGIVALKKDIEDAYKKHAENPSNKGNLATLQSLEFKKNFLIEQIDIEKSFSSIFDKYNELNNSIRLLGNRDNPGANSIRRDYQKSLQEEKVKLGKERLIYKSQSTYLTSDKDALPIIKNDEVLYDKLVRVKRDQILSKEYQVTIQNRISKINSVIGTPATTK